MAADSRALDDIMIRHDLAPLAWRAAWVAARFLADERPEDLVVETKSTPTDAVTAMDRGAEQRIIDTVLAERPDDGILGEEGGERLGTSGVRWVVDPLDGTVNYLYGMPTWGVSIAVERDGRTEVGVVIAPQLAEASIAIRDHGAWAVSGEVCHRMAVGDCADLSQAMVATGFNYRPQVRLEQGTVVQGLLGEIRDIRRSGSAVVDFTWLARGRLDGYFESGLNRWDIAAGALIASESGAIVGALHGDDPYAGVMVTSVPGINASLKALLRDLSAT